MRFIFDVAQVTTNLKAQSLKTTIIKYLVGVVSIIFSVNVNTQKDVFVSTESLKEWLSFVNNNPTSAQKL